MFVPFRRDSNIDTNLYPFYTHPMNQCQLDLSLLPELFSSYPDILAVYLFGSATSGKQHAESDLDLAILPRSSNFRQKRLDLLTDLVKIGFDSVDIIFLDSDDIILQFEAVRPNRLLYKKDDFQHGAFFSKIIRQYFDLLPYLQVQRKAYKQRIINGSTRSHPKTTAKTR